jgi:hypothetical protein
MGVVLFAMFSGIVAADTNSSNSSGTPNSMWDVRGSYTWLLTGTAAEGTWSHDLAITGEYADGTFTGYGGLPAGNSPYVNKGETSETITGQVVGDQITIITTYSGPYNPGYTATFSGTIAPDGTMSGNSPWEWHTTSGAAQQSTSWAHQKQIQEDAQKQIEKEAKGQPLPPWIALLAVIGGIILIRRRDR